MNGRDKEPDNQREIKFTLMEAFQFSTSQIALKTQETTSLVAMEETSAADLLLTCGAAAAADLQIPQQHQHRVPACLLLNLIPQNRFTQHMEAVCE